MTFGAIQYVASKLRHGMGWRSRTLAVTCLALGACVVSSPALRQLQQGHEFSALPAIAAGGRSEGLQFTPASGSAVELKGTSTIGAWTSRSTDIRGQVILNVDEGVLDKLFDQVQGGKAHDATRRQAPLLNLPVRSLPIAEISVPVMSLRGDSMGMDHDMQVALNAAQHPAIEYAFQRLGQSAVGWNSQSNRAELKLSVVGNLKMAGATRPVTMDVIVRRESRGHFLAQAQTSLLMGDFGVTPPVALYGLIKGGNQVRVIFDLRLVLGYSSTDTRPTVQTDDALRE